MEIPIHLFNNHIVNATSLATTFTSSSQDVVSCRRLCFQISWTGSSPVGSLKVQGSNDGITFADDPEVSPVSISGASGSALIKIDNVSYNFAQLVYTSTSGTGTIDIWVNGKRA